MTHPHSHEEKPQDLPDDNVQKNHQTNYVGLKLALPLLGALLLLVGITAGALFYQTAGPQTYRSDAYMLLTPTPRGNINCGGTSCPSNYCHCTGGDACTGFECKDATWVRNVCTSQGRSWCTNIQPGPGMTCCEKGYVCGGGGCVYEGGGGGGTGSTATPTRTRTPTPRVRTVASPTRTRTPTPRVTRTKTPTSRVTRTRTPTPRVTRTRTPTPRVTRTKTPTSRVTRTKTPTSRVTRTKTPTPRTGSCPVSPPYCRSGCKVPGGNYSSVCYAGPTCVPGCKVR